MIVVRNNRVVMTPPTGAAGSTWTIQTLPAGQIMGPAGVRVDFDLQAINWYNCSSGSPLISKVVAHIGGAYVGNHCVAAEYDTGNGAAYDTCITGTATELFSPNCPNPSDTEVINYRVTVPLPGGFGPDLQDGYQWAAEAAPYVFLVPAPGYQNGRELPVIKYAPNDSYTNRPTPTTDAGHRPDYFQGPLPALTAVTFRFGPTSDDPYPPIIGSVTVTPYCDPCDVPPLGWTGVTAVDPANQGGGIPGYTFDGIPYCEGGGSTVGSATGSGSTGSTNGSSGSTGSTSNGSTGSTTGSGTTGSGGLGGGAGGNTSTGSTGSTGSSGSTGSTTGGTGSTGNTSTGSGGYNGSTGVTGCYAYTFDAGLPADMNRSSAVTWDSSGLLQTDDNAGTYLFSPSATTGQAIYYATDVYFGGADDGNRRIIEVGFFATSGDGFAVRLQVGSGDGGFYKYGGGTNTATSDPRIPALHAGRWYRLTVGVTAAAQATAVLIDRTDGSTVSSTSSDLSTEMDSDHPLAGQFGSPALNYGSGYPIYVDNVTICVGQSTYPGDPGATTTDGTPP